MNNVMNPLYITHTPSGAKKKLPLDISYVTKKKVMFGEIYLKLRQTNWNVAKNGVNVVVDELPNQPIVYTCLTIDIWTR